MNRTNKITICTLLVLFLLTPIVHGATVLGYQPSQAEQAQQAQPQPHKIRGRVLNWEYIEDPNGNYYVLELDTNNDGIRDKYIVIDPATVNDEENDDLTLAERGNLEVEVEILWQPGINMWNLRDVTLNP